MNELDLLDWKRHVFELYATVRAARDPADAWTLWREARDELFRTHPQSPLPAEARASFAGLEYFPYDPVFRVVADVEPADAEIREIAGSAGSMTRFRRFGRARFDLADAPQALELFRLVLDFNFAYNPSCAYDPRWACPLTPPASRLALEIRAGERYDPAV